MRLWSLESYKCVGEYPIPDKVPLVDFDFDESKVIQTYYFFIQTRLNLNAIMLQTTYWSEA